MKTTFTKKTIISIMIIIAIITLFADFAYKVNKAFDLQNAKIQMQQDEIEKKNKEIEEKTLTDDQKKLVELEKKKKANIDRLKTLRDEISERIKKTETIEKLQACYDEQVDRIYNNQETDEEYCEEKVREEEEKEYQDRVDQAKKNCYDKKANRDLS